jgi:uncharacterized protein YueI
MKLRANRPINSSLKTITVLLKLFELDFFLLIKYQQFVNSYNLKSRIISTSHTETNRKIK